MRIHAAQVPERSLYDTVLKRSYLWVPSIIRCTQFSGRNSVSQLPSRPPLAIKMPSDVYKASRLIKRESTESQLERASCNNMFLTRFATCPRCPPRSRFGPRTRNYIPDDVISFIATQADGESWARGAQESARGKGRYEEGKGRKCDGRGERRTTRARESERESGTRHLPLPRGNLTFRLGLREPTDPEERVEGTSPT